MSPCSGWEDVTLSAQRSRVQSSEERPCAACLHLQAADARAIDYKSKPVPQLKHASHSCTAVACRPLVLIGEASARWLCKPGLQVQPGPRAGTARQPAHEQEQAALQARPAASAAIATPLPSQGSLPKSIVKQAVQVIASRECENDRSSCLLQVQPAPVASLPGQPAKKQACGCTEDALASALAHLRSLPG